MVRVSVTEFNDQSSRYQDLALSEPVVVTRDGRDRTVLISAEEYFRLKRRDREVFATDEMPDDLIEAIRRSEMDARHAPLDRLLEEGH